MTGRAPGWSAGSTNAGKEIPRIHFEVVARYPHDRAAFTQGLAFYDGKLYESTGRLGQSSVRRVDIRSGRVEQSVWLPDALFGEGGVRICLCAG
jgi:glutamine cyclotransferase